MRAMWGIGVPFLPLCTNAYLDTWHHSDHCAGSYSCPILSYSPTRIEHACWVSTEVAFQTFAHLSLTIAFVTFMWEQETGNQSLSFLNIRFLKFLSCIMDLALNFLILIHLIALTARINTLYHSFFEWLAAVAAVNKFDDVSEKRNRIACWF